MSSEKEFQKKKRELERMLKEKIGKGNFEINENDLSVKLNSAEFSYEEIFKELNSKEEKKGQKRKI